MREAVHIDDGRMCVYTSIATDNIEDRFCADTK